MTGRVDAIDPRAILRIVVDTRQSAAPNQVPQHLSETDEDRIVERLTDKAVGEVMRTLIVPALLMLILYIAGLLTTYFAACNAVESKIDRAISISIREAQHDNREMVEDILRDFSAKLKATSTLPSRVSTPKARTGSR